MSRRGTLGYVEPIVYGSCDWNGVNGTVLLNGAPNWGYEVTGDALACPIVFGSGGMRSEPSVPTKGLRYDVANGVCHGTDPTGPCGSQP